MHTAKHFLNKANVLNSFLDQSLLSVGNQFLSSNSKTLFDELSMRSVKKKKRKEKTSSVIVYQATEMKMQGDTIRNFSRLSIS